MPTLTRRRMISTSAATIGVAAAPMWARAAAQTASLAGFRTTIDGFADEVLAQDPEQATSLGVDIGARAALRAQSSDNSAAGRARFGVLTDSMAARLSRVDRAALSDRD